MRRFFGLFGLLAVLGIGVWVWRNRGEDVIVQKLETVEQIQKRKDLQMASKLQEVVATQSGTYALKVYRLESGESYGFETDKIMPARSAIKVPIVMTAIKLGLDKQYNDLLLRMGKNSDNNAQEKMVKIIGLANLGISNYSENIITVDELVEIWKKVYAEKEVYEKYFTDSIYEDRIALGIPKDVKLIHKVGTDINIWNDSGIIIPQIPNPKSQIPNNNQNSIIKHPKPFILIILNEGVKREEAEKMVPELTRMVWNYETSL